MASKVAVVNLSGSLNAKNREFARLNSPLGCQTPPRRPYRRIGGPRSALDRGIVVYYDSPRSQEQFDRKQFRRRLWRPRTHFEGRGVSLVRLFKALLR